jgi:hypothetical protein
MIAEQATLAPALPEGWDTKSSPSCTISPFPRMSFVGSPEPMFHSSVVKVIVPLPLASAVKFPISPLWYSPTPHFPCFLKVGFQCPPAELPSAAESDFSWIWIAWTPGFKPANFATKSLYRFFNKSTGNCAVLLLQKQWLIS